MRWFKTYSIIHDLHSAPCFQMWAKWAGEIIYKWWIFMDFPAKFDHRLCHLEPTFEFATRPCKRHVSVKQRRGIVEGLRRSSGYSQRRNGRWPFTRQKAADFHQVGRMNNDLQMLGWELWHPRRCCLVVWTCLEHFLSFFFGRITPSINQDSVLIPIISIFHPHDELAAAGTSRLSTSLWRSLGACEARVGIHDGLEILRDILGYVKHRIPETNRCKSHTLQNIHWIYEDTFLYIFFFCPVFLSHWLKKYKKRVLPT